MRRKLTAVLSAWMLLLACTLGLFGSAGASNRVKVYFMAVNETVLDLRSDTMPFLANGDIYVPYTMFDPYTTGINLGVYASYSSNTAMIYSYSYGALMFDLIADTASSSTGEGFSQTAIRRNSIVFVPAKLICDHFNLDCQLLLDTDYGFIVRIKSSAVQLTDQDFAASARYILESRYNAYVRSIGGTEFIGSGAGQGSQGSVTPQTTAPAQQPGPDVSNEPGVPEGGDVYLAFRCGQGGDTAAISAALARKGASALFFFSPQELAVRDDELRALAAAGHRIGLLLTGETEQERAQEAQAGSELLAHILRAGTDIVLVEGEGAPPEGWFWWGSTVDGTVDGGQQLRAIVRSAAGQERCFLLLDDSAQWAGQLTRLLDELAGEGCTFRLAVETALAQEQRLPEA